MNKNTTLYFLLLLLPCTMTAQKAVKTFVPPYKGYFNAPPKLIPTSRPPDAPVTGNGDVGVVLDGTPGKTSIYIGKNDFWKSKSSYPEGGLCLPGGIDVFIPELAGGAYYAEQVLANGNIHAIFKKDELAVSLKVVVPATSNVVIVELAASGKQCTVNSRAWAKHGFESTVDSGMNGNTQFAQRHFDAPELEWPSHVAIAWNTGGRGSSFVIKPGSTVTLVAGICTNHENKNYLATAVARAGNATPAAIKMLQQKNDAWWNKFWSRSSVALGDTMLEKYYYASQYLLACCSRNNDFPPGLCGNSITDDAYNTWEGDYHLNYNYQATWWGAYSSNHIELTEGYDNPVIAYIPKARRHAADELQCRGVYYPTGIGPKGFTATVFPVTEEKMVKRYGTKQSGLVGKVMFRGQRSNAVFLTANMLLRFYTTYDKQYAKKIYPFLKQVDSFWQDYLKYENGYYNSYNDNLWETGPGNPNWQQDMKSGDTNNTATLGLLKMFYRGIQDVSKFLGVDADKVDKWNHIRSNLYPLPVLQYNDVTRLTGAQRGTGPGSLKRSNPGFGRLMGYVWVFPSGNVGVKSDPAFAEILRKEVGRWDTEPGSDAGWRNTGNGFDGNFTTAIRVGYDPAVVIDKLKNRIQQAALPNLWVPQAGGFTETLSGVPSCVNEMLLQGYEGMIRVFPNWLQGRDAAFKTLRTHGAFLVSSEIKNNKVHYITVVSEKGNQCTIENPWIKAPVIKTKTGKRVKVSVTGNLYSFSTQSGVTYTITPQ